MNPVRPFVAYRDRNVEQLKSYENFKKGGLTG